MEYVPDNYDLFKKHDAEMAEALEACPICCECGEHIQDEHCFSFGDKAMHISCMEENHKIPTTYLMG